MHTEATGHDCVYATSGWGIHDERWVAALLEIGFHPHVVSLGRDAADALELREVVLAASTAGGGLRPVLAGPLHSITLPLADLPIPVVGLSWGYDLSDLDRDGADLSWLTRLQGLIVDSEANRAIALAAGVEAERITFMPWGVDLQEFPFHAPWIDAFELGVPPHAPLVLSLRAHESIYRVADIIRAFAAVPRRDDVHEDFPDPHLIIGHRGSLTDELKALVRELDIERRTRFIGTVPEHDLVPLLGRASCYVTASDVDGTSVTLLQAMACGTPVIASDTPGNRGWVVEGQTGFLFPVGDVGALTDCLIEVTARYPQDLVDNARRLVERDADWQANLGRLAQALRSG
ncbi:MAG: glycosyltransferase family 4 protein [Candidatus Nanopelagicales bacterium]